MAPAVAAVLDARKGPGADALPDVRLTTTSTANRQTAFLCPGLSNVW